MSAARRAYLKRYLEAPESVSGDYEVKRKKKKNTIPVKQFQGIKISDDFKGLFDPVEDERDQEDGKTQMLGEKGEDHGWTSRESKNEAQPSIKRDSDDDLSPPRTRKEDDDLSPPRRRREDDGPLPPRRRRNDDDDLPPHRRRKKDDDLSPPRRRGRDGDLSTPRGGKEDGGLSPPRRRRNDGDLSPPRRRREDDDLSPPRRRRNDDGLSPPSRRRNDGDSSPPRRIEGVSSTGGENLVVRSDRPSSDRSSSIMDLPEYTDRRGRKLDMLNQMMRQERGLRSTAEGKMEWGTDKLLGTEDRKSSTEQGNIGRYMPSTTAISNEEEQRERAKFWDDPLEKIRNSSDYLLEEDPLDEKRHKSPNRRKPRIPDRAKVFDDWWPPNRYNIPPSRKWDGVDRSNGFEAKYFQLINEMKMKEELDYKHAVYE